MGHRRRQIGGETLAGGHVRHLFTERLGDPVRIQQGPQRHRPRDRDFGSGHPGGSGRDHAGYADRIQEIHIKLIHALIDHIEIGLGHVAV